MNVLHYRFIRSALEIVMIDFAADYSGTIEKVGLHKLEEFLLK